MRSKIIRYDYEREGEDKKSFIKFNLNDTKKTNFTKIISKVTTAGEIKSLCKKDRFKDSIKSVITVLSDGTNVRVEL